MLDTGQSFNSQKRSARPPSRGTSCSENEVPWSRPNSIRRGSPSASADGAVPIERCIAAIRGAITYGSFYQGRLHLHATEESRATFIKNPEKYPAPKEIAIPSQIAGQRPPVVAQVPAMMGS